MSRIAGHALVEQLVALGAELAFCIPGESFLGVLDGLYESRDHIRVITNRQEGGAAMMASAYGQLTGKPGICLVTRGPGATNASIGLHMANQDANPMVLFIGQVPLPELDRRSFQEIDYRLMFNGIAKEILEIRDPDRVPEYVARAYRTALTGEPGPVVVVLPEDMLRMETSAPLVPSTPVVRPAPGPAELSAVLGVLNEAERPLVVVGGSAWPTAGVEALRSLVQDTGLPFATAFRRQDLIDNSQPGFVGGFGPLSTLGLADRATAADVVLLLGTRPDEQTIAGWLDGAVPRQRILHVHPDANQIGKLLPTEVGVVADAAAFVTAWAEQVESPGGLDSGTESWSSAPPSTLSLRSSVAPWRQQLRTGFDEAQAAAGSPRSQAYMAVLNTVLPADSILTVGAGAYTAWAQRLHDYTQYPTHLGSASGAMGYGLPAAVAAKLVHPEREVVAFAGDGCFQMNGQEIATAVQFGVGITVIVINNGVYGVIRDHQRREFPERPVATELGNPDFAALARAHGAFGAQVSTPEEFAQALADRPGGMTPSVIEVQIPYPDQV